MTHIFGKLLGAFRKDRRGNVAIMAALSMPVIAGSLGVGAEVASWYTSKRVLQNAADSAAIAAATSSDGGFVGEARAVARQYGLAHGLESVSVEAMNEVACPNGAGNKCYRVTISKMQPLLLAQAVGFRGDGVLGGRPVKQISATAIAIQSLAPREYCLLALATSGHTEALRANGVPKADMTGCAVASNSDMRCNGHDLGADFGDAFGVNSGCGKVKNSKLPKVVDPYLGLAKQIPKYDCGGKYPQASEKKKDEPLPSENHLRGLEPRTFIPICGDGELTGNTLLNGGPNVLIVVYGGSLDLADYSIQTQPGTTATIIFTGPELGRPHIPMGGKDTTIDIQAPKTGPWKGVAIYQDPALKQGVNITEAGNSPTWNITGLVYLPHASVTFSGAVNKSSNGHSCFVLVVDNITINGTGSIMDRGECPLAGLRMPEGLSPSRGQLVS